MNDNRTEAEVNVENILIAECDKSPKAQSWTKRPLVKLSVLHAAIEANALGSNVKEVPTLITGISREDMRGLKEWARLPGLQQTQILAVGVNWVVFNSQSHIANDTKFWTQQFQAHFYNYYGSTTFELNTPSVIEYVRSIPFAEKN